MREIRFFGLLHFKKNENKRLNFNSLNDDQKVLVYLKNAILLDKQLKFYGYYLILITNEERYLIRLLKKLNYKIELKTINFKTQVPKDTHFYSCHFRVDIFKYFSKLRNIYSVLLDLDILVLNDPKKIQYCNKKNISLLNDITQNVVPAYGKSRILKKLKILNPDIQKVRWYGGDFFAGNDIFYKFLYQKTKFYQKKFVKNITKLTDQTDELFISASVHDLKKNNSLKINNGNISSIFIRYWNTNVLHSQKKIDYYKRFILLHIPADKIFLSKCYDIFKNKKSYKYEYFKYVSSIKNILSIKASKFLPNQIKKKIKNFYIND
jgi:hypothetical protein